MRLKLVVSKSVEYIYHSLDSHQNQKEYLEQKRMDFLLGFLEQKKKNVQHTINLIFDFISYHQHTTNDIIIFHRD
jgi:hypothetical protein